ncbi:MAG: branched-chain amino acid ABC transporter permease [Acidimicrobiia bacterium]|nr:branched-chain amino acid ABC transporter permease [Acidimicrobiia bacterium]
MSQATPRQRFIEGSKAVSPILLGAVPFGLVIGVSVAATPIDNWVGWATSILIFAGAAQIAVIELINDNALAAVAIATPLIINLRHAMYSAAMAPHFGKLTRADRLWLPYVLTDQAFVISASRYESDSDATTIKWYYLGAALTLWIPWQMATVVGIVVGAEVPPEWSLDFAIALVFLGLLAPAVHNKPSAVAAVVGGVVAVLGLDLPNGTGIIVASIAGVAAGTYADWRLSR